MKSACKLAANALFLVCLAGCSHNDKIVLPPVEEAPALPIATMAQAPALPPLLPSPPPPSVVLVKEEAKNETPPPPPHRPVRRRPKTAGEQANETAQQAQTPSAATEEQAKSTQPAEASPIGQLSAANDNAGTPDRHTITDLIASTENGLKGVTRSLTPDEQKTVMQIRTFLLKARDALKVDDLTGANTLATKAHLLLDELIKS